MKTLVKTTSSLAMVMALAACAVGPDYVKPALAPMQVQSPQVAAFAAQAQTQVQDWWLWFDDAALSAHIEAALASNHDLEQAWANLMVARAAFDERQVDRLPAVTAQASYQRNRQLQAGTQDAAERRTSSAIRLGMDVQWEIDLFGRLARLSRAAQARADAAQAQWQQLRLSLAAEVAYAYFEGQGARHRLAVAEAEVDNWRQTVAVAQAGVEAGNRLPDELENARSQWLRSQAQIPLLRADMQRAAYRLDVLAGQAPGHTAQDVGPASALPLATRLPLGDVDALIRGRPDVVQAERLLAASTEDVGAATADLYPRLDLAGFIGFFALRGADLGSVARAFELAPGASWPALHLGSAKARLRAAQARSQGALSAYYQAVLLAQEEVENAVTLLVEHQQRVQDLLQAGVHAQAALDMAQRRYQAGSGSYLAVLENQRTLFDLKREAALAETASYINVVALYKALGWGVSPL